MLGDKSPCKLYDAGPLSKGIYGKVKNVCIRGFSRIVKCRDIILLNDIPEYKDLSLPSRKICLH